MKIGNNNSGKIILRGEDSKRMFDVIYRPYRIPKTMITARYPLEMTVTETSNGYEINISNCSVDFLKNL